MPDDYPQYLEHGPPPRAPKMRAFFGEGDRLAIMPGVKVWSVDVVRGYDTFLLEEDDVTFREYMPVSVSAFVRMSPRRIYGKRRLRLGDKAPLRLIHAGREYRFPVAVVFEVGEKAIEFRASGSPAIVAG
jgi:hypothetical protein